MNKKGIKILIVEDEVITARCLCLDLEDIGCIVIATTASGEDAVAIASREKPDLIFMDICLAGEMDGIEAAEMIISEYDIPICFISGYATEEILGKALRLNPLKFIEKPFNITQLKFLIDDLKL